MPLGAFSLIFDRNQRVLLCKRTDIDLWNLPGGHVEPGEAPWDAAVREAKEEIGVVITIERLVGVYFKPEKDDLVFQFVAHITSGIPTTSVEAKEVAYFSVKELPKNISLRQRERIELYAADPNHFRLLKQ